MAEISDDPVGRRRQARDPASDLFINQAMKRHEKTPMRPNSTVQ
jgi:hypothetical protein